MTKVAFIIITRNRLESLKITLRSIAGIDYPLFRVVIVDNSDEDKRLKLSEARKILPFPVEIIETSPGPWGELRNKGIEAALEEEADYIFSSDDDITFEPDAISELMGVMGKRKDIGVAAPTVCYTKLPNTVWYGGASFSFSKGRKINNKSSNYEKLRSQHPEEVDWSFGGTSLLRGSVLRKIGLYDPSLRAGDDLDLSLKVRKAGYKITWVPSARIYHAGYAPDLTTAEINPVRYYFDYESLYTIYRRNLPWFQIPRIFLFLLRKAYWEFEDSLREGGMELKYAWSALINSVLGRDAPPYDRCPKWLFKMARWKADRNKIN